MKPRIAGFWTAGAALIVLGTVYYAQFGLNMVPCELCLWERWPYRIVVVLGLLGVLTGRRWPLGIAGLVMLAGVGIAFLHVGVEAGWWLSPLPECNGALTLGAALPLTPATPCDKPAFLVPGLPVSMALMDFVVALAFAVLLLAYALRKPGRVA